MLREALGDLGGDSYRVDTILFECLLDHNTHLDESKLTRFAHELERKKSYPMSSTQEDNNSLTLFNLISVVTLLNFIYFSYLSVLIRLISLRHIRYAHKAQRDDSITNQRPFFQPVLDEMREQM